MKSSWKPLGRKLLLSEKELHDMDTQDPILSASQVLLRWKMRQDPEEDLLSALAEALNKCSRPELTSVVIKGNFVLPCRADWHFGLIKQESVHLPVWVWFSHLSCLTVWAVAPLFISPEPMSWGELLVLPPSPSVVRILFVSSEQCSGRDYAITFSVWLVVQLVVRMWHFGESFLCAL